MENIKIFRIKNFKSIKELKLECKRVNIFIGKPNTGKSNIIESLVFYTGLPINGIVRFSSLDNLFYDNQINESILLRINNVIIKIFYSKTYDYIVGIIDENTNAVRKEYSTQQFGNGQIHHIEEIPFSLKYYIFRETKDIIDSQPNSLSYPYGANLYSLLETNNEIYEYADDLLKSYGYDLVLRQATKEIEFVKRSGRKLITFPYYLIADTLRRMIFFNTAIMTNSNSTLIFEEPESYAFPYYTKELAENIANDENKNQYFITTHNPYFLKTIVDKTKSDELCVFYTYYKDYQTYVKELPKDKLIQFFLKPDIDIFLNIDKFEETL
ncbi:MAG: AAA family ATPase [Ignavibacteria bacterium]|nr:AAA family ATPase [Ignavibacteria bacterium]